MSSVRHLVVRAVGSIPNRAAPTAAHTLARSVLLEAEYAMWCEMDGRDQRHSVTVLERFDCFATGATRAERAAALLHDVGKSASRLGWVLRVCATVVGPRGQRFANYHNHEDIGAEMLEGVSHPRTVALVGGRVDDDVATALRKADNV